jgi:hypothetical protein
MGFPAISGFSVNHGKGLKKKFRGMSQMFVLLS